MKNLADLLYIKCTNKKCIDYVICEHTKDCDCFFDYIVNKHKILSRISISFNYVLQLGFTRNYWLDNKLENVEIFIFFITLQIYVGK